MQRPSAARSWHGTVMFALAAVLGIAATAHGEVKWSERLGFPPQARVVVLHVGEAGLAYETGAAALQLVCAELPVSLAAMPPTPWFDHFAQAVRDHRGADLGVALTLTSHSKTYRFPPVGRRGGGLADADGFLWHAPGPLAANATAAEVEQELEAQIRRFRAAGLEPTHLTPHGGAVLINAETTAAYLRVSRKHWIPAVLVEITPAHLEQFRRAGFPLSPEMIQLIASHPLPKLDDFRFLPDAARYEEKAAAFRRLIRELPPGLTQIVLQPALPSEAMRQLSPRWQQRAWERDLLLDPDTYQFLRDEGVLLTDWREIMYRFETGGPPAAENLDDEAAETAPAPAPAGEQ